MVLPVFAGSGRQFTPELSPDIALTLTEHEPSRTPSSNWSTGWAGRTRLRSCSGREPAPCAPQPTQTRGTRHEHRNAVCVKSGGCSAVFSCSA
jgi:hypothetical protein